jgi:hypothetical protein
MIGIEMGSVNFVYEVSVVDGFAASGNCHIVNVTVPYLL